MAALKARIRIEQGRLSEALNWAQTQNLSIDDSLSYLHEFEHVTLARALIAHEQRERAEKTTREAVGLLNRLLKAAEEGGRMGSALEILVLLALAHKAEGNIPLALAQLERALALAEPEGYVRIFVDEGMPITELLRVMASQGIMADYASRLLAAFDVEEPLASEQTYSPQTQPAAPQPTSFIEPLTKRELDVLSLIAAGKKNQEIADQLIISLNTVRYHTKNLYGKLGVNKRTQAVAKAQELNLI